MFGHSDWDGRERGRAQPLREWHSCGGNDKNWLELTRSKMAEGSNSSITGASVCAHCNTLASKWHTHRCQDSSKMTIKGQKVGDAPITGNPLPFPQKSWDNSPTWKPMELPSPEKTQCLSCSNLLRWPTSAYGMCLSLNKAAFTLLRLVLEFFPARIQGPSPGASSQGRLRDLGTGPSSPAPFSCNKMTKIYFSCISDLHPQLLWGRPTP